MFSFSSVKAIGLAAGCPILAIVHQICTLRSNLRMSEITDYSAGGGMGGGGGGEEGHTPQTPLVRILHCLTSQKLLPMGRAQSQT